MEFSAKIKSLLSAVSKNIFKNKKAYFAVLLFFVVAGTIFPKEIKAWPSSLNPFDPEFYVADINFFTGNCGNLNTLNMTPEQRAAYSKCLYGASAQQQALDNGLGKIEDGLNFLDKAAKGFFMALITGVCTLIILFVSTLASMMGSLFLWIFQAGSVISYTKFTNPVIASGWPIVRNFANMIVVLGFVVIAIATILRFKDYEAKKLLPKLIIAALLINFSLVICGVFIDASNIVISGIGEKSGGYLQKSWTQNTSEAMGAMWKNFDVNKPAESLGISIGLVFTETMRFVIYSLFFFLFLFRILALWTLVVLSPLAFVAAVFPAGKEFWNTWKKNFVAWCIIGIPATFFLWLGDKIKEGMISSNSTASSTAGGAGSFMSFLIPGCFMIIGFIFSLQTSAMGASMITSRANNYFNKGKAMLGGMATGGVKKTLGGLANISGASRLYQAGKKGFVKTAEKFGLATPGTAAEMDKESVSKNKKLAENLTTRQINDRLNVLNKKKWLSDDQVKEKAAYAQVLIDREDFDASDSETGRLHKDALNTAQKKGYSVPGDAKRKSPMLAGLDVSKVQDKADKLVAQSIKDHEEDNSKPILTKEQATKQASQELVQEAVQRQSPREFRNNVKSFTPEIINAATDEQLASVLTDGSQKSKDNLSKTIQNHINELQKNKRGKEADDLRLRNERIRNGIFTKNEQGGYSNDEDEEDEGITVGGGRSSGGGGRGGISGTGMRGESFSGPNNPTVRPPSGEESEEPEETESAPTAPITPPTPSTRRRGGRRYHHRRGKITLPSGPKAEAKIREFIGADKWGQYVQEEIVEPISEIAGAVKKVAGKVGITKENMKKLWKDESAGATIGKKPEPEIPEPVEPEIAPPPPKSKSESGEYKLQEPTPVSQATPFTDKYITEAEVDELLKEPSKKATKKNETEELIKNPDEIEKKRKEVEELIKNPDKKKDG